MVSRMRSTGASQGFGGNGDRTSSIVKSPSGSRATPTGLELKGVALAGGPQNNVAKTLKPAVVPMPSPPAKSSPRPRTRMRPSVLAFASRSAIRQICPGGFMPRTTLGWAVTVDPLTMTLEIGSTPIPPLNLTSVLLGPLVPKAESVMMPTSTIPRPKILFITLLLALDFGKETHGRKCLGDCGRGTPSIRQVRQVSIDSQGGNDGSHYHGVDSADHRGAPMLRTWVRFPSPAP